MIERVFHLQILETDYDLRTDKKVLEIKMPFVKIDKKLMKKIVKSVLALEAEVDKIRKQEEKALGEQRK